MSFLEFKSALKSLRPFSLTDIRKVYSNFDQRRLTEWQQKGYLVKLINGRYIFSDDQVDEQMLFAIGCYLLRPSYISLETGLFYHGLIPEQPFSITAVTTMTTKSYATPVGNFVYRHLKPGLYFGYEVMHRTGGRPILMASIEKSLIDYFYMNPQLNTIEAIEAVRFNRQILQDIDRTKLETFLAAFDSEALCRRFKLFEREYC